MPEQYPSSRIISMSYSVRWRMRWASTSISLSLKYFTWSSSSVRIWPQGLVHLLLGGDIVAGGVDGHMVQHPVHRTGEGVKVGDPVDLIPEELHPDGVVLIVGG